MVIADGVDPNIQGKAQLLASGSYSDVVIDFVLTAEEADSEDGSNPHKMA